MSSLSGNFKEKPQNCGPRNPCSSAKASLQIIKYKNGEGSQTWFLLLPFSSNLIFSLTYFALIIAKLIRVSCAVLYWRYIPQYQAWIRVCWMLVQVKLGGKCLSMQTHYFKPNQSWVQSLTPSEYPPCVSANKLQRSYQCHKIYNYSTTLVLEFSFFHFGMKECAWKSSLICTLHFNYFCPL